MSNRPNEATLLDRGFQLAYVCAYRLMRTYWRLRKPTTHGALVAIWSGGSVLLVRNSYVPYYSAPGGYIHRGETAVEAARRELEEEIGVHVKTEQLALALEVTHAWEGKLDHVQIFEIELEQRPVIAIDHREVIEAAWFRVDEVKEMNVFPPLKRVIVEGR